MNMNKKQMTMLAVGVIAIVAIYWFFFRNKKDETKKESSFNPDYLVIGDEMGYSKSKGGLKPDTSNSTQSMRPIPERIRRQIAENGSTSNPGGGAVARCSAPGSHSNMPGCSLCAWGPFRWWENCANPANNGGMYLKWD